MSNTLPFNHIYLIDGSGYIFRAFYGIPPMTRPDGTPVNAVFGYTNMLIKLLADHESDGFAVIFDAGRESFRNDFYPEYKAQRPDAPEELIPQFGLIREATRAFNLPSIEMKGYEADDLIATYAREAKEAGVKVTIVSSDKDLMQLVEPGIELLDPMKNIAIGEEQVLAKFGVKPDRVVDVQALAGDSVDNVPGVPGIGIKTAAQLINEYGDLESLLERAEEIKQPKRRQNLIEHAELARISRRLVELKRDVPVDDDLSGFDRMDPDGAVLRAFLEENGFRSIIARLGEMLGGSPEASESAEPEAAPAKPNMNWSRQEPRWNAGSPRRTGKALLRSTPKPPGWMLTARNWSVSASPARRAKPATYPSATAHRTLMPPTPPIRADWI